MELRGLGLQGGLACASFIMDEASHEKKIAQRAERVKSVWDPRMGPEGFGMGGLSRGGRRQGGMPSVFFNEYTGLEVGAGVLWKGWMRA